MLDGTKRKGRVRGGGLDFERLSSPLGRAGTEERTMDRSILSWYYAMRCNLKKPLRDY